jgi:UDP-N-acetylglucosamine 1-carboxyvinyltransferase
LIEGVESLGCEHRFSSDMIEIGSWIGLAAMTRSERLPSKMSVGIIWVIPSTF